MEKHLEIRLKIGHCLYLGRISLKKKLWILAIKNSFGMAYISLVLSFIISVLVQTEIDVVQSVNVLISISSCLGIVFTMLLVFFTKETDTKVRWQVGSIFIIISIQIIGYCITTAPLRLEGRLFLGTASVFLSVLLGYKNYISKWMKWKTRSGKSKFENVASCIMIFLLGVTFLYERTFGRPFFEFLNEQYTNVELDSLIWIFLFCASMFFAYVGGMYCGIDATETLKKYKRR